MLYIQACISKLAGLAFSYQELAVKLLRISSNNLRHIFWGGQSTPAQHHLPLSCLPHGLQTLHHTLCCSLLLPELSPSTAVTQLQGSSPSRDSWDVSMEQNKRSVSL